MNPLSSIGAGAPIPNPALKPLEFLIGEWRTAGTHPQVPGETLRGRTSFSWHEGGAFLIIRSEIDQAQFPSGLAIIASDDSAGRLVMSWFDERRVSRIFDVIVGNRSLTWRREHPAFSQWTTLFAHRDGDTLVSTGRMSIDGGDWVDDLSQVYSREAG